jgi:hypothetical protein
VEATKQKEEKKKNKKRNLSPFQEGRSVGTDIKHFRHICTKPDFDIMKQLLHYFLQEKVVEATKQKEEKRKKPKPDERVTRVTVYR